MLAAALARAAGVYHVPGRGDFLTGTSLDTEVRLGGWSSHELAAEHAAGREHELRDLVADRLRDRENRPVADGDQAGSAVLWSARSALRIGFLDAVFLGCRFVLCVRDPAGATEEMMRSWTSGEFVSEPELPDWPGPAWSLPLIPAGKSSAVSR